MTTSKAKKMVSHLGDFAFRFLGIRNSERIIRALARSSGIDLLRLAHDELGIGRCGDFIYSGEQLVMTDVLPKVVHSQKPVFFDVGANVGSYSLGLRGYFPDARIIAFEPNKATFAHLEKALVDANVELVCMGLSVSPGASKMYDYNATAASGHATMHPQVFSQFFHTAAPTSFEIQLDSLDHACSERDISEIDFIKIDTEGHELEVLKGAAGMLGSGSIRAIQFEFNEMNVVSRSYLKDFYELLCDFRFYRLNTKRLVPLPEYRPENEIFRFQNFLAIHKNISSDSYADIC